MSNRNPLIEKQENITKEMIINYERIRRSGITNMFDLKFVGELTGLSKEQILCIMSNYTELMGKFKSDIQEIFS